jgi:hypothetical protein
VDTTEFETQRRAIMDEAEPSRGDNLAGMYHDIEAYLSGSPLLGQSVEVRMTTEPNCMLVGTCQPIDSSVSPQQIAMEFECIWLERLRYRYREAHELRIEPNAVTLDFVTQVDPGAFYVTGSLIATLPQPD